jgi:preprotein translocase subunit Sec61beta
MMMSEGQKPERATPLQVARAVFWSFFGIRKRAAYEKDAAALTPLQVIVAGIIGAVIVVLSIVTLVRFITS